MKKHLLLVALVALVALGALWTTQLAAEVVLRPHDPAASLRTPQLDTEKALVPLTKVDQPATLLIVPFFIVDTTNPSGTATLFAMRNLEVAQVAVEIEYFTPSFNLIRQDLLTVGARETLSVNVRDIAGLPADGDGLARGLVRLTSSGSAVGDFFQVDVGGNFATGDRLISASDFCDQHEIRFLDFGSGTDLWMILNIPQGSDPDVDPPSASVSILSEDGASFPGADIYTDQGLTKLTAADFTGLDFGTLVFNMANSGGGFLFAGYSADGRFSVGVNSACVIP